MSILWEKSAGWRWLVRRTRDSKPFFFTFAALCGVVPGVIGYGVMQLTSSRNEQLEAHLRSTARPETMVRALPSYRSHRDRWMLFFIVTVINYALRFEVTVWGSKRLIGRSTLHVQSVSHLKFMNFKDTAACLRGWWNWTRVWALSFEGYIERAAFHWNVQVVLVFNFPCLA